MGDFISNNVMLTSILLLCVWYMAKCYIPVAYKSDLHIHFLSMFCPTLETSGILQDSESFSVAAVLLKSTSEAICSGTIAVQEIRVLTADARSQKNFGEILNTLHANVRAKAIVQDLQVAKNCLQMFEQERSTVLTLTNTFQGHCQAEAKSKHFGTHALLAVQDRSSALYMGLTLNVTCLLHYCSLSDH